MGRRDYRHREPKKAKRNSKKPAVDTIIQPPMTVEVIKKKRKVQEEEED
jgi:hypothetical protein